MKVGLSKGEEWAEGRKFLQKLVRNRYLYLMLAPAVLLVLLFNYLTLSGWILAFTDYRLGQSFSTLSWAGLKNFRTFFTGQDFGYLMTNTLVINICSLFLNLFAAMAFAVLLNELPWKRWARGVQTISFFPFFVSWITVYSMMNALFSVSSGAVNRFLTDAGIIEHGWNVLGSEKYAWGLAILLSLWKTLGYNGVIFISAIAGIPQEEFEAAEIDGANRWEKIRCITLPNLAPTLIVLLIMNSGWILNSNFDFYYIFQNSTNWMRMEVLDMYIYKFGLRQGNYPYAIAVGMMKTVVSIVLLTVVNRITRRLSDQSIL